MQIHHLIFLIHPCCYELLGRDNPQVRRDNLEIFFERENEVRKRWLDAFGELDEAALLLQLYGPKYLLEAAQKPHGEANACYVQAEFPGESQLREFYRRLTQCIRDHMAKFDLHFDPAKVTSEIWGESFEGCAPGYGGAFAEYLGLRQPPRMRFEMTVSDTRFLTGAKVFEPIPLVDSDIEAWLFECYDQTSAAIFQARQSAQWLDKRPIKLKLDPTRMQVCTKTGFTVWPQRQPAKGDPDTPEPFSFSTSDMYWIRGISMGVDDLRRIVSSAVVGEASEQAQV